MHGVISLPDTTSYDKYHTNTMQTNPKHSEQETQNTNCHMQQEHNESNNKLSPSKIITALFDLVDTVGLKVQYQGVYDKQICYMPGEKPVS